MGLSISSVIVLILYLTPFKTSSKMSTEYDTLSLRNRDVTETLSPLDDLGQDENDPEEFDKLALRNRTVTETLSPVSDLGKKTKKKTTKGKKNEGKEEEEFDKLELRNRVVTETLSPMADLGKKKTTKGKKRKNKV